MTEKELLDNDNFMHVVLRIPMESVRMEMDCKILDDTVVKTLRGFFDMEAIREIRKDFLSLWDNSRNTETADKDTSEMKVAVSIPKNTIKCHVCSYVLEDDQLESRETPYNAGEIRQMRNEYLELDPDDDFFSYCVINEDFGEDEEEK